MVSDNNEVTFHAKLTILGDQRVGKTSIRKRYMGQGFSKTHLMTLGADFAQKQVQVNDSTTMNLQIWDIAGQDSFKLVRKRFLAHSDATLLVFDITRKNTFHNLTRWLEDLWEVNKGEIIPLLIIGNKIDLTDEREVSQAEVQKYIKYLKGLDKPTSHMIDSIETSALTGENIDEGFSIITDNILKNHEV